MGFKLKLLMLSVVGMMLCALIFVGLLYNEMGMYQANNPELSNAEAFDLAMDSYFGSSEKISKRVDPSTITPAASTHSEYATRPSGVLNIIIAPDESGTAFKQRPAITQMIAGLVEYIKAPWALNIFGFGTNVSHIGPAYTDSDRSQLVKDWENHSRYEGFGWSKQALSRGWNNRGLYVLYPRDRFPLDDQHTNITLGFLRIFEYAITRIKAGETVQVVMATDADHDPPQYQIGTDNQLQQQINTLLSDIPKEYQNRLHILVVSIGGGIENGEQFKRERLNGYPNVDVRQVGDWEDILPVIAERQKQLVGSFSIVNKPESMPTFALPSENTPLEIAIELDLVGPEQANFVPRVRVFDRDKDDPFADFLVDTEIDRVNYRIARQDGKPAYVNGVIPVRRGDRFAVSLFENAGHPSFGESANLEVNISFVPVDNVITLNDESGPFSLRLTQSGSFVRNWYVYLIYMPIGFVIVFCALVAYLVIRKKRIQKERKRQIEDAMKPELNGTVTYGVETATLKGTDPLQIGSINFHLNGHGGIAITSQYPLDLECEDIESLERKQERVAPNVPYDLPLNVESVMLTEIRPDDDLEDAITYTYRSPSAFAVVA